MVKQQQQRQQQQKQQQKFSCFIMYFLHNKEECILSLYI